MKTSEDTRYEPSVVAETLRSLSEQARVCHDKIDQLESGQSVNRAEVLAEVGKLLDACQNLRDAILSEDNTASWKSKSELAALVSRLDDAAEKRRRYLDLAEFLATGTITHRRERTRQERLALRDAAVAELMEISERSTPPELPGPEPEAWLEWACNLEDSSDEIELQKLKNGFPRLDDFVRQLEIEWWHSASDLPASEAPIRKPSPEIPAPKIEAHASLWHGSAPEKLAVPEPSPALEMEPPSPASEPTEILRVEEPHAAVAEQEQALAPIASDPILELKPAEPDQTTEIPILSLSKPEEISPETRNPSRNGKISLFPWDQVDLFTSHIERAKIERKDARTVRALLAVSHWLEPKEQNPLTHPKCGIRALTDHSSGADFEWVSPADVAQTIAMDDGLPILTGGADLLRWGLLQPSERNFQGIASIQRLTKEHLRAWFSELYRIALSDKQIDDIYNLTSGIPMLVGELHKLIIPAPDEPPTWLGLARWIEIKGLFEKQLPTVGHELKKGTPAFRLTDREISLLNMIVIVSPESNEETILSNLSENWERFQRPQYRSFSSRDEISLAVLLDLGLLPMRMVTGVEPSRALLPLSQNDAVYKIIEHL